ncbi:MAG TPA: uracil-DNA glycosylase family protein [Polyangiaceae bacterium]|nr:uracil-DNA glycosylase family protein [Polyangiaceae bacterium]
MIELVRISSDLSKRVQALEFAKPVSHVYNPLQYAWQSHADYLTRYGKGTKQALLLGMNPGPFGMAQTGVPVGDVNLVRDWMGVSAPVSKPKREHPKRLITGFACPKSEVSGSRLWGWAKARFKTPERFFERFFVINYCPLCFMEEGGKNLTPDKLPKAEQIALFRACDEALAAAIRVLQPRYVIGVGGFAEKRASLVVKSLEPQLREAITVGTILHPSPASPLANRGWAAAAERDFAKLGLKL